MKKLLLIATLIAASGLLLLTGCKEKAKVTATAADRVTQKPMIRVQTPLVRDISRYCAFTGRTQAADIVPVAAQVPGEILKVEVVEGQRVKKGDVLLRLDDQQQKLALAQAESGLAQAEAQLGQLKIITEMEEKNVEIMVGRANAGLKQVLAKSKMVDTGARPEEREQARAAQDMAKAQVEALKRELQRMSKLYKEEVIPKQQLDTLEDQFRVAKAQYSQAAAAAELVNLGARNEDREAMAAAVEEMELQVEAAKTGLQKVEADRLQIKATEYAIEGGRQGLALAKLALEKTVVTSPVDGLVDSLPATKGMVTGAGIPLVYVVDDSRLEVHTAFSDQDSVRIRAGMSVKLTADAFPDREFKGRVTWLGTVFDPQQGGFPAHVEVLEGGGAGLGTGMFVRGKVLLDIGKNSLLVPIDTVLHREGTRVVFVHAGGKVRMQPVQLGARDGSLVEITAGVKPTDEIVSEGQLTMVDGMEVMTRAGAATAPANAAAPAPAVTLPAPAAKPAPAGRSKK